jgi:protein TonB
MTLKLIPFISCLLFSFAAKSQSANTSDNMNRQKPQTFNDTMKVFHKVEVEAEFPGGTAGWTQYLRKKLDPLVPVRMKAPPGHYNVFARFIVGKDGNIIDVKAETNFGYGMEWELVRIIKKGPKWIPATRDGIPVSAYRRQSVTFIVSAQ